MEEHSHKSRLYTLFPLTPQCGGGILLNTTWLEWKSWFPTLPSLTSLWQRSWGTSLQLGEGGSLGFPLVFSGIDWSEATVFFQWCLAGVGWLLSKSFSVLLACPFPGPLAKEWRLLWGFFWGGGWGHWYFQVASLVLNVDIWGKETQVNHHQFVGAGGVQHL